MALPISFRFPESLLADIDRVRGDVPRSTWVQRLCGDAVAAHDALGAARGPALAAKLYGRSGESMTEPGTDQGVSGAGQPAVSDQAVGVSGDRGAQTGQPPRSVEADAEYVRRKAIAATHPSSCGCVNCDYVRSQDA